MSKRFLASDHRRSYQGSPKHRSTYEEEDDEEDVEIKLSPSGSVLMASANPYDKTQRLREANTQLRNTKMPTKRTGKVRFNEKVIMFSEDYATDTRNPRNYSGNQPSSRQGQNKILLVTVPTGFSEDNDDGVVSDEGDEVSDETAFRCGSGQEHESPAVVNEEEIVHEIIESEQADELVGLEESVPEEAVESEVKNLCNEMSVKCSLVVNKESTPITSIKEVRERIQSAHPKHRKSEKLAKKEEKNEARPKSAPSKRLCLCDDPSSLQQKLPSYNGFRSEYGLSAEQLLERKKCAAAKNLHDARLTLSKTSQRKRLEMTKVLRKEREERYLEEKRRQKENDQMFLTWLVKKKKEAAMKYARRRQQNSYYFKTLPAPTSHLDKMGVLRRKVLSKREHTCYSLEEFFKHAKPHEQKTYKIYLGLCVE